MNIEVKSEPVYVITLSREEMSKLWKIAYDFRNLGCLGNPKYEWLFNCLEDARPAGGF